MIGMSAPTGRSSPHNMIDGAPQSKLGASAPISRGSPHGETVGAPQSERHGAPVSVQKEGCFFVILYLCTGSRSRAYGHAKQNMGGEPR